MKYRDNMTHADTAQLLDEAAALDAAYANAADADAAQAEADRLALAADPELIDEMTELHKAALSKGRP